MRIVLVSLLLLALLCPGLSALARAAESEAANMDAAPEADAPEREYYQAGCITTPCGACEIDQVSIVITCCKERCSSCTQGFDATLRIDLLDGDGAVLSFGDVKSHFCDPCAPKQQYIAKLSQSVCPQDIKGALVSLVAGPEHGIQVDNMTISLRDPYGRLGVCPRWHSVFKTCNPCCQKLGGGTDWEFSVQACCCSKCVARPCCNRPVCKVCNRCRRHKCGCERACEPEPKPLPTCKCRDSGGAAPAPSGGCSSCGKEPACGCSKCSKSGCGCSKCGSCGGCKCGCSSCHTKCGCGKVSGGSSSSSGGCSTCGGK